MTTILFTALCLARHLLPEAAALLAEIETNAAILSLSVVIFVTSRVWPRLGRR